MIIPRSPFSFQMEKDEMHLTLSTAPIEYSSVVWPTYEVDGRVYLQENFIFDVPKGASVIKMSIPSRYGIPIAKCTVIDADTNVVWFKNALNTVPVYSYIGVTQNERYNLKLDGMSVIDAAYGDLKLESSYDINNIEITVEDYKD